LENYKKYLNKQCNERKQVNESKEIESKEIESKQVNESKVNENQPKDKQLEIIELNNNIENMKNRLISYIDNNDIDNT